MDMNVFMVQSLLTKLFVAGIGTDGIYGPQTERALMQSPVELANVLEIYHPNRLQFLSTKIEVEMKQHDPEDLLETVRAILQASRELKVPLTWLMGFAKIESNFNPQATNGGSRGLYQMQAGAWSDAAKTVTLPDYESNWDNPYWNARAAAAYLLISVKSLASRGYDVSDPRQLYLAHQQGVSGVIELIQAYQTENEPRKSVIRDKALLGNRAPGTRKTTIRSEFYVNWMNYLRKFF